MKIIVIGANGQIGSHLLNQLSQDKDHTVTAMVRTKEQAEHHQSKGINTVVSNLEGSVDEIYHAISDHDAVIFTAGSGGKTGDDKTLLIDLDGAAKTIEAAEQANITRFIMISAHQAHNRSNWYEPLKPYYVAKHFADKILTSSSLNYTIIRPGALLNESATGKIAAGENLERGSIPREDVASTAAASINNKHTFYTSFDLISGDKLIDEALESLK